MLGVLSGVFEHDKHDRTNTKNLRWSCNTLSDHTHFQTIHIFHDFTGNYQNFIILVTLSRLVSLLMF